MPYTSIEKTVAEILSLGLWTVGFLGLTILVLALVEWTERRKKKDD